MTAASTLISCRFGRFELRLEERQLLADGVAVRITPHALDILAVLLEHAGHLVTKEQLRARVWPRVVVEENTLQVHISALRKVLGADAVATVLGQGYRFVPEVVSIPGASASAHPARNHNLPNQLTSFVGREREIAQIKELLPSTRLLTLSGTGGCGKTRLALRVAEGLVDEYPDGIWLVELAPLGDPSLIPQTIAGVLAVKEQGGRAFAESVPEWLGSRHLLLVLDNAEHLLGACADFVDRLLKRCDRLEILVTSRERLGLAGELTYRVPSLSIPGSQDGVPSEEVLACEAARLFIERARLHRPGLDFTAKDAGALTSICRHLDGIALAIELAAPRVRVMSLGELSRHLEDRFAVLTDGSRTALPRHRTLRSLIDWSYDLLSSAEKTMLRRASVFAGGWTVETAEAICSGADIERGASLELLTSLLDKSLLVTEIGDDATRFEMLETVRQYAQARLHESGEEEPVRDRHVEYFVSRANNIDAMQSDSDRRAKLSRLDDEHDNIRAALAWCEEAPARAVAGLHLAGGLLVFWRTRGLYSEARNWITRLLAVADGPRAEAHARALFAAGTLAFSQGDDDEAEAQQREALGIWRRLGDCRQISRSLLGLGNVALARRDRAGARELYEESVAMARAAADLRGIVVGLNCVGLVAYELADYATAQARLEECLPLSREVGSWSTSGVLSLLGDVKHAQGHFEEARTLLMAALEGHREFGDREAIGATLLRLAVVLHDCRDISAAVARLEEALGLLRFISANYVAAWLETFAALSVEFAGETCAARLWGCARRLREEMGTELATPSVRGRQERLVASARSTLADDAAFDAAWAEGRSWAADDALRYAAEQSAGRT